MVGALGLRWRGRFAGGAVGVEVSIRAPHCNASFVMPTGASPLGGRTLELCTRFELGVGKLAAGSVLGLGLGGARFRF